MAKSILKGLFGIGLLFIGLMTLPYTALVLLGSVIVNAIIPSALTNLFVSLSIIGIIIQIAMIWFGIKFVNANQTPFISLLVGLVGVATIIVSILILTGSSVTVVGGIAGLALLIMGVGIFDMGFHTKFMKPVSGTIMKIK